MLHLNLARAIRAKGILKQHRFLQNLGFYNAKITLLKNNQEKVIALMSSKHFATTCGVHRMIFLIGKPMLNTLCLGIPST